MPRYFLHLRDSKNEALDTEGLILSRETMPGVVLTQALDCIAGDVKNGKLDLHYRIDVHDEAGELVYSLNFTDAIKVVPAH